MHATEKDHNCCYCRVWNRHSHWGALRVRNHSHPMEEGSGLVGIDCFAGHKPDLGFVLGSYVRTPDFAHILLPLHIRAKGTAQERHPGADLVADQTVRHRDLGYYEGFVADYS